jgi:hypothetical protein
MATGEFVRLENYWFRVERKEARGVLFLRYANERNEISATHVRELFEQKLDTGQLLGTDTWTGRGVRIEALRWDVKAEILHLKVTRV